MLLAQNHCKIRPLALSGSGGGGVSDHVGVSERMLVTAGRKLLSPVDDGRLEEAAATQLEEGHQVPHDAQIVGILSQRNGLWEFPLVVGEARPLCCGQSQERNLVKLQQQYHGRPGGVVKGQEEDTEHPGRAADQIGENAPESQLLVMQRAVTRPVHETTVEHPGSQHHEGHQEENEEVMVPSTDAAVGPDRVVILLRHTRIASEAVVSSHGFLDHTRCTENPGV